MEEEEEESEANITETLLPTKSTTLIIVAHHTKIILGVLEYSTWSAPYSRYTTGMEYLVGWLVNKTNLKIFGVNKTIDYTKA